VPFYLLWSTFPLGKLSSPVLQRDPTLIAVSNWMCPYLALRYLLCFFFVVEGRLDVRDLASYSTF